MHPEQDDLRRLSQRGERRRFVKQPGQQAEGRGGPSRAAIHPGTGRQGDGQRRPGEDPGAIASRHFAAFFFMVASRTWRNSVPGFHSGYTAPRATMSPTSRSSRASSTAPDRSQSDFTSSLGLW